MIATGRPEYRSSSERGRFHGPTVGPLETLRRCVAVLDEVMHPDGYHIGLNLGAAAGAGVPGHLHWHIVPRWHGDTNFMPIVADVKVIVQSLDTLYDYLAPRLPPE